MTISDITGTAGGFTVHNLALSGAVKISFSSVTVRPHILSSVLSLQPVSEITFEGGQVQLGQIINFGTGGTLLTVSLGAGEVLMENLHTSGPFAIAGYLSVNPQAMRIIRADARLSVPDEFAPSMNMLSSFLPLVQEGGRWYLRRK